MRTRHLLTLMVFLSVLFSGCAGAQQPISTPDLGSFGASRETEGLVSPEPGVSSPQPDALASAGTKTIEASIRQREYEITPARDGSQPAYQAPNRAHNLRTYFDADGVRIRPRTGDAGQKTTGWEVGLRLAAYGREGSLAPAGPAQSPAAAGNRIEYARPGLTEWYVNDEAGLEQGFTLESAPDGSEQAAVVIQIAVSGAPAVAGDGSWVEFAAPGGDAVLRYGQLRAVDAGGRVLDARAFGGPIRLRDRAACGRAGRGLPDHRGSRHLYPDAPPGRRLGGARRPGRRGVRHVRCVCG